jgi:hypothetical protein
MLKMMMKKEYVVFQSSRKYKYTVLDFLILDEEPAT